MSPPNPIPDPPSEPRTQGQSPWTTARTGAAVGFFAGLPLAAFIVRTILGEPSALWAVLLWPVFPLVFASAFGAAAHVREGRSRRRLADFRFEERHRAGLAWSLIILSPVLAALIATSALRISALGFLPTAVDVVTPFFALATSPLAALGPAAGALMLRLPIAARVALGLTFGVAGFFVFWATDSLMMRLFGFF